MPSPTAWIDLTLLEERAQWAQDPDVPDVWASARPAADFLDTVPTARLLDLPEAPRREPARGPSLGAALGLSVSLSADVSAGLAPLPGHRRAQLA